MADSRPERIKTLRAARGLLKTQMDAHRMDYAKLTQEMYALENEEARDQFDVLAYPIVWAPVLTDDFKIKLVAWCDEPQEASARDEIFKIYGLDKDSNPKVPLPIPRDQSHADGSLVCEGDFDLAIVPNTLPQLSNIVEQFTLRISNRSGSLDKIEAHIETLTKLRKLVLDLE